MRRSQMLKSPLQDTNDSFCSYSAYKDYQSYDIKHPKTDHYSNHHRSLSLARPKKDSFENYKQTLNHELSHKDEKDQFKYSQYCKKDMQSVIPSYKDELVYEPPKNRFGNKYQNQYNNQDQYQSRNQYGSNYHAPLSSADEQRKKIADENHKIIRQNPHLIDRKGVKTITNDYYFSIPRNIHRDGLIFIFECSSIFAAIKSHSQTPNKKICLLNFANSIKPGGGYLNGRNAQEECLCRQTLLYPTIDGNFMYIANKENGCKPEASDIMIYSPNVLVIRDDDYKMIDPFKINIISSAAVDNRKRNVRNCDEIMYRRIKKIIMTAASEKNEILILGAFGCGVFKNDPYKTAQNFYNVLVKEGLKNNFDKIIFPIFNNPRQYQIFKSTFDKY